MSGAAPAPTLLRVGAGCAGWPLRGTQATRAVEQAAAATLPPHALMQRAGAAVARLAIALAPHARQVWIPAGPGNNGGDGLQAAAQLQRAGRTVRVSLADAATLPADAAAALAEAQAAGVRIQAGIAAGPLDAQDLAIDALFGIGLKRPPAGWATQAIGELARLKAPVLAIDVPSGLDADTGACPGDAVRARWTLALLTLKPGLFTAHGRDCSGEVWFDALGVAAGSDAASARLLASHAGLWPARRHAQHKGSFGDVWVLGGAPGMAGAALLAARAAAAAGAGRVLLAMLDARFPGVDARAPELMLRSPAALADRATPLESATVVCGCGGGDAIRDGLALAIARAGRLVVDADALNALAADAGLRPLLQARAARRRPTLLTPHPLEAARLLGSSTRAVQADRLAAAGALAARYAATVVLKGSGSVVASPGVPPWVNASGNAALASAGSGDVLAGWIGGLWSQGLNAEAAACLGVHAHGAAADRWAAGRERPAVLGAGALIEALRASA